VIDEDQVDLVEALIHSYPQYVQVADLPDVGGGGQEKVTSLSFLSFFISCSRLAWTADTRVLGKPFSSQVFRSHLCPEVSCLGFLLQLKFVTRLYETGLLLTDAPVMTS
jgi:hypothetical protein